MNNINEVKRTQGGIYKTVGLLKQFIAVNQIIIADCSRNENLSDEEAKANAEFICKAVNEYDSIKKELEGMYALNKEGWNKVEYYEKQRNELLEALKDAQHLLNVAPIIGKEDLMNTIKAAILKAEAK